MSDKELISRGAEVVTGDLILNRKVVGNYRNGQFILTPEGADELENVVEVSAKDVTPPRKSKAKAIVAEAEPASPIMDSIDDLLKD